MSAVRFGRKAASGARRYLALVVKAGRPSVRLTAGSRERALCCFDARLARLSALAPDGFAQQGEVWSPFEADAWAPRPPPPRGKPVRLSKFHESRPFGT